MAFQAKTDFCGLSSITELAQLLLVRSDNENKTAENYQPQGQDGSIIANEVFGEDSAPSNSYGLKGDINLAAGKIKLNKITEINGKKYALESVTISTSGGSPVAISATCQEIESGASENGQCHYSVPALTILKKHHAQILFGAFTITGAGCSLTECEAVIGGSISKDKVEGVKVSSDINSGLITVTGTVLQSGSTVPTIAANTTDGWVLTAPPTCANDEAVYKTYSFTVTKALAKDVVTPPSNGGGSQST